MKMMRKVAFVVVTALLIAGVWVVTASADGDANGAACRAVTWLQSQQKPDGGFGAGGKSSAPVTADVVYVLGLLGEEVDGPSWTTPDGNNALDALEALGVPAWAQADPGQAGKVARAVAVAGANPRDFGGVDLVAMIESFYDPATGLYHPAWLFRHSLAMEGLLRSGVTVPRAAHDALLAAQLPDGAWFWSKDGTQGDVDTTGRVLYLLAGLAKVPGNSPYEKAADWLEDMRLPEGGWNTGFETDPPAPPNGNSTALAIAGLMATGQDPAAALVDGDGKSLLETLLAFQEPSGAFVFIKQPGLEEGRLVATTEALSVLALLLEEQTACALPYLPMILAL